jgi:hypothetical protein
MKKIYTILFLCVILLLSTEVKAQIVKGEAFMGLNLTQIDGDKAYGYKHPGFHGGLGAIVPIYQKDYFDIDFSLEVVFNHRGAHQGRIYADTLSNGDIITGEYDVHMNYLEVPMMIYFSDKQIYSLGIGASYGRLVGLREYEHGKLTDVNLNYQGEDRYKLSDWCILADLKFRLHERLKFGIRYQYSLAEIRNRDFILVNGQPDPEWQNVSQYNNVVTARLIYVFNEDRSQYIYDEYHFTGDNPKIHQKAIDKQLKKLKKKQAKAAKKAGKK